MIVGFEISSKTYYAQKLERPTWPGGASGVTIGIGYDLGYNTKAKITADWGNRLSPADLAALLTSAGKTGAAARAMIPGLRHVKVPLADATAVFEANTLPRYAGDTRRAYPGVEALPADAQGALLSLVFNRGSAMSGDRRREMRAIKALVTARDLRGIAAQIVAMKRLWNARELPGLHKRRDAEAKLVEQARTSYPASELVSV